MSDDNGCFLSGVFLILAGIAGGGIYIYTNSLILTIIAAGFLFLIAAILAASRSDTP